MPQVISPAPAIQPFGSWARRARWGIVLVLAVFGILGFAFSIVIPLGEAADEVSHYAYVQSLVANKTMPKPEGAVLGESHQPPLYYAIAALLTGWIPQENLVVLANPDFVLYDPQTPNLLLHPRSEGFPYQSAPLAWHLTRVFSILLGAVTVWAAWQTARVVAPDNHALALGVASFVAFLPSFLSLAAVVNNDNLIIALAALIFLLVVTTQLRGMTTRRAILLGVLLGLAVLTKLSGLVLWGFVGISFLLFWFQSQSRAALIRPFLLCFAIAFIIAAPYFVYNWQTHADPLGWNLYLQVGTIRETPWTFADLPKLTRDLFTSFFGRFGGALQLEFAPPLYLIFGIVIVGALVGWVVAARRSLLDETTRRVAVLAAILILLLSIAYFRWALYDLGAGQARQLLPTLVPIGLVLTLGWSYLFSSHRASLAGWSVGFCAVGVFALLFLNTIFAPPILNAVPSGQQSLSSPLEFGKTIRVLAYQVETNELAAGQEIPVALTWQAIRAPSENYWLSLQLVQGEEGIASKDGVPSAGRRTTDWWAPGEIYNSRHVLQVPPDAQPGKYSLMLGLHPIGVWAWLPINDQPMVRLTNLNITDRSP